MMTTTLATYLSNLDSDSNALLHQEDLKETQQLWFDRLDENVRSGLELFQLSSEGNRNKYMSFFWNCVQTEKLKAWYGAPDKGDLFQGTSISSLTVPYQVARPLPLNSIEQLEQQIAEAYIKIHHCHKDTVSNAIGEDTSAWLESGLFYGLVLPSKLLSQAFDLSVSYQDAVFEVGGQLIDPHQILSHPSHIRTAYFEECRNKIDCFKGIELTQAEFESSLVLADISKPKIEKYLDKLLLAPIRCNEICCLSANRVAKQIRELSSGQLKVPSLSVTICDTDTPYTYHLTERHLSSPFGPILPGLVVQGTSGSIDAFRWLYSYRVSLISQKMMKGSLYSEVKRCYTPFIFFGVLVPRDADILLDMNKLSLLRYRGNISPQIEYLYLLKKIENQLSTEDNYDFNHDFECRISLP